MLTAIAAAKLIWRITTCQLNYSKTEKEIPDQVHVDPYLCTYYYEINNQSPFTDARVREALKLGMDRDIIVNKVKNQEIYPLMVSPHPIPVARSWRRQSGLAGHKKNVMK